MSIFSYISNCVLRILSKSFFRGIMLTGPASQIHMTRHSDLKNFAFRAQICCKWRIFRLRSMPRELRCSASWLQRTALLIRSSRKLELQRGRGGRWRIPKRKWNDPPRLRLKRCPPPGNFISAPESGLQIRGLKFQSSNSNSRELELTNLLGLVLGCIEARFCK